MSPMVAVVKTGLEVVPGLAPVLDARKWQTAAVLD